MEFEQKCEIEKAFDNRNVTHKLISLQLAQPLLPHFKTELEKLGYSVAYIVELVEERYVYVIRFE